MNNKMNVYLVDDSMEMIHSMKEALTKSDGYQVIGSATNGEQCVNELRGKHLDVLVLDLIMPKKDGISVLHDLKKNHIQVDHIICTTPFVNDLIVAGVQNYRIDYILMKPFEIEQLCDKLNFIVGYTRKEHISSNVVKVDHKGAVSGNRQEICNHGIPCGKSHSTRNRGSMEQRQHRCN